MVSPISLQPVSFFRAVSHSNGNEARRVTLPSDWVRHYSYPKNIFLIKGNILIIADVGDEVLAMKAAELLHKEGLMGPLVKPEMEEVTK